MRDLVGFNLRTGFLAGTAKAVPVFLVSRTSPFLALCRGESKEGEVPSFVVSIRGSFEGGRNRNLPPSNVLSLFVHFLFARAKIRERPNL